METGMIKKIHFIWIVCVVTLIFSTPNAHSKSDVFKENIFDLGQLKPSDSVLKVKVGDRAPGFALPAVSGGKVTLSQYYGKKNVVISFVPAAWTPVCSDQWPSYNAVKEKVFDKYDAILIGITLDNIPTLFAWTRQMGKLWFHVLSDFWPHGAVADRYGVLRSDGMSERALFLIDKKGIIRYINVHNINKKPLLLPLVIELGKLQKKD